MKENFLLRRGIRIPARQRSMSLVTKRPSSGAEGFQQHAKRKGSFPAWPTPFFSTHSAGKFIALAVDLKRFACAERILDAETLRYVPFWYFAGLQS